jgi:hypothetical protein
MSLMNDEEETKSQSRSVLSPGIRNMVFRWESCVVDQHVNVNTPLCNHD